MDKREACDELDQKLIAFFNFALDNNRALFDGGESATLSNSLGWRQFVLLTNEFCEGEGIAEGQYTMNVQRRIWGQPTWRLRAIVDFLYGKSVGHVWGQDDNRYAASFKPQYNDLDKLAGCYRDFSFKVKLHLLAASLRDDETS